MGGFVDETVGGGSGSGGVVGTFVLPGAPIDCSIFLDLRKTTPQVIETARITTTAQITAATIISLHRDLPHVEFEDSTCRGSR